MTLIEAGIVTFSESDRIVSGMLLPYGEHVSTAHRTTTAAGTYTVERGTISIPTDPVVVGFNLEHAREDSIGRAATLTDTDAGVIATFRIADGPEGDAAIADIKAGRRKSLSAEVTGLIVQGGKTVAGRLFGAALCARGAFASAALFSIDEEPPADPDADPEAPATEPKTTEEKYSDEYTDENGVTHKRTTTTTTVVDGDTTTITAKTVIEEPETPTEGDNVNQPATVAPGLYSGAPASGAPGTPKTIDKNAFFAMVAAAVRDGDHSPAMFALNDVKISGAGALGTAVVQPDFVGQVWSGRRYQRRIIPLTGSGTLLKLTAKGWRFVTEPSVSEWAGNKANVPSSTATTEEVTWDTTRFAGGWDIAREFYDFGETEVIEAFLRLAADSYAKKSDDKHLANLLAAATSAPVGTIPAGLGSGVTKIVRGALRVITNDAVPSYAVVAPDVFEEVLLTKKDDVLAFLSMSLGLEEGQVENFKIVPHVDMAAGAVLVGAKEAAAAYELPGSPIRVSAIDIVKGGLDEALFGYLQTRVEYPTGLQLVTSNA